MVCLEVVLVTRDLGLNRARGSSPRRSLLCTANCRYGGTTARSSLWPAGRVAGRVGGGMLSHKGGETWEGKPRVA